MIEYKKKYIKYKIKYLNLIGGSDKNMENMIGIFEKQQPKTEFSQFIEKPILSKSKHQEEIINLKECNPITISINDKRIKELLVNPYSLDNYEKIFNRFKEITKPNPTINEYSYKTCLFNKIEKIKSENTDEVQKKIKINEFSTLEEACSVILNLDEYVKIFSFHPFYLSEEVKSIRDSISSFSFIYTKSNIEEFLNNLLILMVKLCQDINYLIKKLTSEQFDAISIVNLKDSLFLSFRFQNEAKEDGIYIDLDQLIANVFVQILAKFSEISGRIKILFGTNYDIKYKINDTLIEVNELIKDKEKRIIIKPIFDLNTKIKTMIILCNYANYNIFTEKFYKYKENCEKNFCSNIDDFLLVLDTLKEDIPSNKCNMYDKKSVSKYDFYSLLKEIGMILITFSPKQKDIIEKKIKEVTKYLDKTDRIKSWGKKVLDKL
jgi:hypothetical protein